MTAECNARALPPMPARPGHSLHALPEGFGLSFRLQPRCVLVNYDQGFFTAEVWTAGGLTTYYVLVFMRIAPRQVSIAGITLAPDGEWMKQMARNMTMAGDGFLRAAVAICCTIATPSLAPRFARFCARLVSNPWRCPREVRI